MSRRLSATFAATLAATRLFRVADSGRSSGRSFEPKEAAKWQMSFRLSQVQKWQIDPYYKKSFTKKGA